MRPAIVLALIAVAVPVAALFRRRRGRAGGRDAAVLLSGRPAAANVRRRHATVGLRRAGRPGCPPPGRALFMTAFREGG
jgi:hypothetical protein